MPSAYKWRALPAGTLGHSSNPETIRRNRNRARLTPLETAFERGWANRGNRLKQRSDFARGYGEYQALDDETKAEVDREMIAEENEILEQERQAILADWWQHYPNQFGQDGSPLANPPIPIEVDTLPNSPAPPVNPSPKMHPVARMKSLLDRVAKRPRSSSMGSTRLAGSAPAPSPSPASASCHSPTLQGRSPSFTMHGAAGPSVASSVAPAMGLARAATFPTSSTREPISVRTRLRNRFGSQNSCANHPQASK